LIDPNGDILLKTGIADSVSELEGVALIGVPLSKPSMSHSGTRRVMLSGYRTYTITEGCDMKGSLLYDCGDMETHVTDINESHRRIRDTIHQLTKKKQN